MSKKGNEKFDARAMFEATGVFITLSFVIFHMALGALQHSVWNGTIGVYYFFLFMVKALLVLSKRRIQKEEEAKKKRIYVLSFALLLLTDVALIAPGAFLILGLKETNVGKITSIAMAAYAFYSVIASLLDIRKSNRVRADLLEKQYRLVKLNNAIASIIFLQNTLIVTNGGYTEGLKFTSIVTTFLFIALLFFVNCFSFVKNNQTLHSK